MRLPSQFEYSSLRQPVSLSDMRPYVSDVLRDTPIGLYIWLAVMTLGGVFFVLFGASLSGGGDEVEFALLSSVIILVMWVFMGFLLYLQARRRVRLARFALHNGIGYRHLIKDPDYPGVIFSIGDTCKVNDSLHASDDGWEIGEYQYSTGSGKSRQTVKYIFARMKLARRVPHIVLDSKKNNAWFISNLPAVFANIQKVELEGEFSEHFNVYAPINYETDLRYVLTPDVMLELISQDAVFDAELVDDSLFLYLQRDIALDKEENLEKIRRLLERVGGQISKQTKLYSDDRAVNTSLLASSAIIAVAPEGRRLKPGFNIAAAVILVIIVVQMLVPFLSVVFRDVDITIVRIALTIVMIAVAIIVIMSRRCK